MAYYQKKKEPVKVNKKTRTLSDICKDCGRYWYIPTHFCNECQKEISKTINKYNPVIKTCNKEN